jgi:hypothetical protein
MRNSAGASDKLRLVLPNTTLPAMAHAMLFCWWMGAASQFRNICVTARDRRMGRRLPCAKEKDWGTNTPSGCGAKPSRRCRTKSGKESKSARGGLGIPAAPYAFRLAMLASAKEAGSSWEKRYGEQAAVYCCVFPVRISGARIDRRARRGSRLLPTICQGGPRPGARSPGRPSLRRWRAGRPLVNGFFGSL